MQSATLDTSCALNFLMTDEEPDDDLMDVISLALGGKIAANVSEEAFIEVEGTGDAAARERRITRLKTFGRLEIPAERVDESDIRRVLSPLAADYPDFDLWLTGALNKEGTRVRVGEYEGHVAAVALSQ